MNHWEAPAPAPTAVVVAAAAAVVVAGAAAVVVAAAAAIVVAAAAPAAEAGFQLAVEKAPSLNLKSPNMLHYFKYATLFKNIFTECSNS